MIKFAYHILLTLLIAIVAMPIFAQAPKVIPLQKTKDIKAVYQVTDLTEHEGVHKALFYVKKVLGGYAKLGVPAGEIDLHLVYHSGAIPALLNDSAYQRLTGKSDGNRTRPEQTLEC